MESLTKQVKEQIVAEDVKETYLELIQKIIREEYLKMLETEIAKAFITAYEEQAQSLFESYLDNAECYTTAAKVKDKITREEREPDEKFMRSIEEMIGVVGSARDGFRSDVTSYMFSKMRRGETIDFRTYGPLKRSNRRVHDNVCKRYCKNRNSITIYEMTIKRKNMVTWSGHFIEEYGYNECSAEEILTYASNNLWRDS